MKLIKRRLFFTLLFLFLFTGIANSNIIPSYTERINKIQAHIKNQEFQQAEASVRAMLKQDQKNIELNSMLARLLFWQKKYVESIELYKRVLMTEKGKVLQQELEAVEVAKAIDEAGVLVHDKDFIKAETVVRDMSARYPNNTELTAMLARLLFWQKKYDASIELYKRVLMTEKSETLQKELEAVEVAKALDEAGVLVHDKDFIRAETVVRDMSARYPNNTELTAMLARLLFWQKKYDGSIEVYKRVLMTEKGEALQRELEAVEVAKAIDEAGVLINDKDFIKAETVVRDMSARYPNNTELTAMLARLLFWQRKYDESLEVYKKLLSITDNTTIRIEMKKIEAARALSEADILIVKGDIDSAIKLLRPIFESGMDYYDAGYKLGMLYIQKREYEKAIDIFQRLEIIFPEDNGFKALYIEALLLNGDIEKAKEELNTLSQDMKDYISREKRDDLFYRVRKNYLKAAVSFFGYAGSDRKNETEQSLELSQRIKDLTFVVNAANIHRYGLTDNQLTVTVYSKLGEKTKRGGYLTFSISPGANFLPKNTFGGTVYQGYGIFEFYLGYNRMNFTNSSVDIVIPGIIAYLPYNFSLNEELYIVPKNGSYSLVSSLTYEPNHEFHALYSISTGKSAETIRSLEDIQKLNTLSSRLEAEYRVNPSLSLGAALYYESRRPLYVKNGLSVFSRYWW